jgi:hypothetical protein
MTNKFLETFQQVTGWKTPERFGREHDGFVTIEENARSHNHDAFFWDADMGHERLQTMWMDGLYFVRRLLTR